MKKEKFSEIKLRKTIASIYSQYPPDKSPKKAYQEFVNTFPEIIKYSDWLTIFIEGRKPDLIVKDILNYLKKNKEVIKKSESRLLSKMMPKKSNDVIPLKFNRDAVRENYLRSYPELKHNSKKMGLLLIRRSLLGKNALFVKDWNELQEALHDLKRGKVSREFHLNKYREFQNKWNVDPDDGVYYVNAEPDPIVWYVQGDRAENMFVPTVTLRIDLRYSKQKIMDALKASVDYWHSFIHRALKFEKFAKETLEPLGIETAIGKLHGNILSDLKDYEKYLSIWSMKMENRMSWSQIVKEWNRNNNEQITTQTARNWFNKACDLIQEGIPGFLPFPQK